MVKGQKRVRNRQILIVDLCVSGKYMLSGRIYGFRPANPRIGGFEVLRTTWDEAGSLWIQPITARGYREAPGRTASAAPWMLSGLRERGAISNVPLGSSPMGSNSFPASSVAI